MEFSCIVMKITLRLNLILGLMILSVPALSFALLVLTTPSLMKFSNLIVMIMVLSLNLLAIFLVFPLLWTLVLRLNKNKSLFLKLPMSALNKEVI